MSNKKQSLHWRGKFREGTALIGAKLKHLNSDSLVQAKRPTQGNYMATRRLATVVTVLMLGLLPHTAFGLFQNKTEESVTVAAGYLAQASYWNSGTNGWTLARYSKAGVPISYYRRVHGTKYSGGQYLDDDYLNGSYAVAEMYWDGTIYNCVRSRVENVNDAGAYAHSHLTQ